jgi:hypothetical protein
MLGLTTLGVIHTAISLVALATGAFALIRDRKISWNNTIGKVYIITTILTCLTGFGIFQHGGFGKPHILGVITLLVLAIAYWASTDKKPVFSFSPYAEVVGYSMTFFFHLIPGFTETLTRLPLAGPIASGPDDPKLQTIVGVCFVLFLIGATLQVLKLRKEMAPKDAQAVQATPTV